MSSSDTDLEKLRMEYETSIRTVVDGLYGNVTAFIRSRQIMDLESNATQIYDDFMADARKILDQSDQIQEDLQVMIKDFIQAAFKKRAAGKGVDPKKVQVYAFQGNFETLARRFVEDLGKLGADPETRTLSIYKLADKVIREVTELADRTMKEVTGANYSVASLEADVMDAFMAVSGDAFDRRVIVNELSAMIDGLGELYGYGDEVNTKQTIKSAADWVDARLNDYSDGSISKIPGNVLVAPLILLDYVVGKVSIVTGVFIPSLPLISN